MAGTLASARARERVDAISSTAPDARALRLQVLEEVRRAVGFDAYAWLLTDPQTSVGTSPLADVPWLPELPRAVRLKYLTPVNRWTALPSDRVVSLHAATGGDLTRSELWRELLTGYGVTDGASAAFRDKHGCWGFLDLWRCGARFSDDELDVLSQLLAPITRGLRRCVARDLQRTGTAPRSTGPVVLLLSPDLQVRAQTAETAEYLRLLVPRDDGLPPVPANAYNVAAQLLAVEAGVDANPPVARVHLAVGRWLTLRAARIGPDTGDRAQDVAVTIEDAAPPERVELFGRTFGLSPREKELVGLLLQGEDTRQVAARLHLSEHTVQDHLKSVFARTGVRSRRALLSLASGTAGQDPARVPGPERAGR